MDTSISSSVETEPKIVVKGRGRNPKSIANLKPNHGDLKPNPKGITGPRIKPVVNKLLTKDRIEKIAEKIVSNAENGIETKVDTLLKLTNDLSDVPPAPITNNNTIIGNDVLEAAIEYLKQKQLSNG